MPERFHVYVLRGFIKELEGEIDIVELNGNYESCENSLWKHSYIGFDHELPSVFDLVQDSW